MAVERSLSDLEEVVRKASEGRDADLLSDEKAQFGVVHTPPELCRYTVRELCRAHSRAGATLADTEVVDPACGPGQFLAAALAHLGPSARGVTLRGLDRDPDACAMAESLLRAPCDAVGAKLVLEVRDTLEVRLRPERPVSIIGNPPWAGRTASRGDEQAMAAFLVDDHGQPLGEKRVGVLSDAYIRFLAWALREVQEHGGGLALVTGSSFLDGPVHRGVRGALRRGLSEIHVTDLGGSALIARDPDRGPDANLFGVRPGVSVTVGRARAEVDRSQALTRTKVDYVRVRGHLEEKLAWLLDPERASESQASGYELSPQPPAHRFVPAPAQPFPDDWLALDALFPFHAEGLQSNRDAVVTDPDRDVLLGRMQAFALGLQRPDLAAAERSSRHYDPERARTVIREALERDPEGETWIRPLAYRPMQPRYAVTLSPLCHRPRPALARAIDASSVVLYSVRKDRGERLWRHAAAGRHMPDGCLLSSRSSCRTRGFPSHDEHGEQNLSELGKSYERPSERVVHYALGVLSSSLYRSRFDDALKADYPRIPPPGPRFDAIADLGASLIEVIADASSEPRVQGVVGHHSTSLPRTYPALVHALDATLIRVIEDTDTH